MCGLSEVDVEGEHGMHRGIVVEVSSGLQACVCGGSASGGGEVGGGGGGEGAAERVSSCIHNFQPLSMPGDKSDLAKRQKLSTPKRCVVAVPVGRRRECIEDSQISNHFQ